MFVGLKPKILNCSLIFLLYKQIIHDIFLMTRKIIDHPTTITIYRLQGGDLKLNMMT